MEETSLDERLRERELHSHHMNGKGIETGDMERL